MACNTYSCLYAFSYIYVKHLETRIYVYNFDISSRKVENT